MTVFAIIFSAMAFMTVFMIMPDASKAAAAMEKIFQILDNTYEIDARKSSGINTTYNIDLVVKV